jgi:hypothetical protein
MGMDEVVNTLKAMHHALAGCGKREGGSYGIKHRDVQMF